MQRDPDRVGEAMGDARDAGSGSSLVNDHVDELDPAKAEPSQRPAGGFRLFVDHRFGPFAGRLRLDDRIP